MAVTILVLSYRFKSEVPGSIHNSASASFGRSLFAWSGANVNGVTIRSLTCGIRCYTNRCPCWQDSTWSSFSWLMRHLLWLPPPPAPGLTLLGKLKLSYVRSLSKPGLRRGSFNRVFLWLKYLIWIVFGLRNDGSKIHSRHWEYVVYKNHSSLCSMLYSLKCFKCTFTAVNHQANDLLKTGMSKKEWREWPT